MSRSDQNDNYPLTRLHLQQMKRQELRDLCRKRNYRVIGPPTTLRQRLVTGDAMRAQRPHLNVEPISPKPTLVDLVCPPAPKKAGGFGSRTVSSFLLLLLLGWATLYHHQNEL